MSVLLALVLCCWVSGRALGLDQGLLGVRVLGLGCLGPLSLLAAVAEASSRSAGLARAFGPRMDYDEWTPLGHGDPLKNDPTYDYVPPVLDRVHYWMMDSNKETGARRDESFVKYVDNSVPVPPTMLVPPPLPPPVSTTPASPLPPPLPTSVYSSLNPFHHFEDRPVVPNVLFESPGSGGLSAGPQAGTLPLGPSFLDKPPRDSAPLPPPEAGNVVVLDVEKQPFLGGPTPLPDAVPSRQPPPAKQQNPDKPNAIRLENNKAVPSKLAFPSQNGVRGPPGKPLRFDDQPPRQQQVQVQQQVLMQVQQPPKMVHPQPPPQPSKMQPPPRKQGAAVTPPTTTTSLAPPPTPPTPPTPRPAPSAQGASSSSSAAMSSDTINSLIRGLLHQEVVTTMTTLTTDPLFAHYKQPVTPVNVHGPAYVIIQGHSKVKTYGPVLRRYDPPQSPQRAQS